MLTAAVAGDVFASPPASTVYAAIRAAAGPKGALLIVKNYTGDRLNFGLAAERARAEGIPVEVVIVGEDCALPRGASKAGRRGLAGTLFVHKVSGALAELGHSLEEILPAAQAVAADIATMSVSLAPCLVPGRGPCFTLPPGTMGIGLGIHGEEGVSREPLVASRVVARRLVQGLLNSDDGFGYFQAERGQRVALLLNNLGGTSMLELQVMMADILEELVDVRGLRVERVYFGSMMTSLAMAGVSVTLMHLEDKIANMPREIVRRTGGQFCLSASHF
jgi:dihydroxyacetone kinase